MPNQYEHFALKFNPFEPAGSGVPTGEKEPWLPANWKAKLQEYFDQLSGGEGIRPLAVVGEYGSGKSYLLHWLDQHEFPKYRVQSYYFNDPGVQFYDLANQLLRRIGRKQFSKLLWELVHQYVKPRQASLFVGTYEDYLEGRLKNDRPRLTKEIQEAVVKSKITADEEIAHCLARVVVETPNKPYFEYRDFLSGTGKSLVAQREGARYFTAVLRTLRLAAGTEKVAFLIDEFEEISLHRNINAAAAQDYRVTLKRLIDLTTDGELWLVLSLTPDGADKTKKLDPALWDRMFPFKLEPLSDGEARELVQQRLAGARPDGKPSIHDLFPFEEDFLEALRPTTRSTPRSLVKVCFAALNQAANERKKSVSKATVQAAEKNLLPLGEGERP